MLRGKFLYSSSQLLCLCIYHALLLISIKWRGQANYLPEEDIAPGIAPHTQVNFTYFISSTWELYFLYVIINVVLFFILNLCADETEDEMVGWYHWLDGHEFEQAPGVGDGNLVCYSPWGRKESGMIEQLNWTELNLCVYVWVCLVGRGWLIRGRGFFYFHLSLD